MRHGEFICRRRGRGEDLQLARLLPCLVARGSHGVPARVLAWDNTVSREREVRKGTWDVGFEEKGKHEGLQLAYLLHWTTHWCVHRECPVVLGTRTQR